MTNQHDNETAGESSSPACSMHEADDAYMSYMAREELIAFLNELLEAERAGARVTLESARAARSGRIAQVISDIQRDEARWCAMLARHLKAFGITPSMKVGAFYEKAMAFRYAPQGSNGNQAAPTRPAAPPAMVAEWQR